MPGVVRNSGKDVTGGSNIKGSPDVFVNNKPVVRVGDNVAGHGPGPHAAPVMVAGSTNVFTNNIETCRQGDPASCGHTASGSSDTFIN